MNTISTVAEAVGLLAGAGVLVAALCLPLWLGLVRRNRLWGARTHTALASDENWEVINRATGRVGTLWGAAMAVLAVVAWAGLPEGLSKAVYNLLVAVPVVGMAIHVSVAAIRAERPLRERQTVQRWPDGHVES